MLTVIEILGFIGAILTGLVLGLLGGGGAAISIPILVYAFGVPASVATGYSLLIVGSTALLGTVQNLRMGLIRSKALLRCGLPALISIYMMRRYIIHSIPKVFFSIGGYQMTKDGFILLLLSFFMIMVGRNMISASRPDTKEITSTPYISILIQSIFIGLFTGMVGAGGGFLLIPLLLSSEPMEFRNATATSLTLVMINSFIGFMGDLQSHLVIDWRFMLSFIGCSALGVIAGISVAHKIDNKKLRKVFGYAMLTIALFILIKEFIMKLFL